MWNCCFCWPTYKIFERHSFKTNENFVNKSHETSGLIQSTEPCLRLHRTNNIRVQDEGTHTVCYT